MEKELRELLEKQSEWFLLFLIMRKRSECRETDLKVSCQKALVRFEDNA